MAGTVSPTAPLRAGTVERQSYNKCGDPGKGYGRRYDSEGVASGQGMWYASADEYEYQQQAKQYTGKALEHLHGVSLSRITDLFRHRQYTTGLPEMRIMTGRGKAAAHEP